MKILILITISTALYISSILISKVFYRTDLKQSLKEIIISGVFFVAIFSFAFWVSFELIKGRTSYYALFLSLPIYFTIFSSYNYLVFPRLQYFFRKKSLTNEYDSFLSNAGIKVDVIKIENLDNACAMGLLNGTYTILIGEKLIDRMTATQISGIILHEIAHIKQNHLFVMWLIDLVAFYFFVGMLLLVKLYIIDSDVVTVITSGILGGVTYYFRFPVRYLEKQADVYAAQHIGKEEYISTLKVLYGDKKERWSVDHPKLSNRIKNIEEKC